MDFIFIGHFAAGRGEIESQADPFWCWELEDAALGDVNAVVTYSACNEACGRALNCKSTC